MMMNRFSGWRKEWGGVLRGCWVTRGQGKVETMDFSRVDAGDCVCRRKQARKFLFGLGAKLAEEDGFFPVLFAIGEYGQQLDTHFVAASGSRERPIQIDDGLIVFEASDQSRVFRVIRLIVNEDCQRTGLILSEWNSDPGPDSLSPRAEFQPLADRRRTHIQGGQGFE